MHAIVSARQTVLGWGMAVGGPADVVRLYDPQSAAAVLDWARHHGRTVALRGGGCSYGDAAYGDVVIDLSGMDHILRFDPATGVVRAQAGATLQQIWQAAVPHGWWPPVVSGTMAPTLGGAAAMNIHGKNAFRVGPIGDHLLAIKVVFPSGEHRELTPADPLFFAVVSGAGTLGVITEVELQLKRVEAARLDVWATTAPDLDGLFGFFERHAASADYLVAWLDAFATGKGLGRSLIHAAYHLHAGDEADTGQALQVHSQQLPTRLFGVVPKAWMWRFLKPFSNPRGMRLVNLGRWWSGVLLARDKRYRQTHGAFHFLLDYVPDWKKVYSPGGLIQHQAFVPADRARAVFQALLEMQQRRGLVNWLSVVKRHRADRFLLSHGLDGYSLAQDFAVTTANRAALWQLCHDMDDLVAAAGGRVYFAKDATVRPESVLAMFGPDRLLQWATWQQHCDPAGVLQSAQWRRAVAPAVAMARSRP
ncbi:MAG: FAD-binding oxidoreductase [Deltaproteobacteria bacterium]|nr:FAD-binding oxidoreductase [Deltaproteobacteria bacterium]